MSDGTVRDVLTFYHVSTNEAVVPGTVIEEAGKKYRYVQNGATVTATSGYPLVYVGTEFAVGDWDVSADLTAGVAEGVFAGVAMADMAVNEYGWILIDGIYDTCTVNAAGVTAGNAVVCDADGGTDGTFDVAGADDLMVVCGIAIEAITTDANGPIWIKGL